MNEKKKLWLLLALLLASLAFAWYVNHTATSSLIP